MLLIDYYKIRAEKCIFDESILDANNIYERELKELFTVAHLFKISDESRNKANLILSTKIKNDDSIEFPVNTMVERFFNIVEKAPITNTLSRLTHLFDQSEGEEPSLRELMALISANIQILSPKDKKTSIFRLHVSLYIISKSFIKFFTNVFLLFNSLT